MQKVSSGWIWQLLLTILILQAPVAGTSQKLISPDIDSLLQTILALPHSLEEMHRQFTRDIKYGNKFNEPLLSDPHQQLLACIKEIHDATIRAKIAQHRRADMTFEVQYDDERLKLLLRPTIRASMTKRTIGASATTRELVKQLAQLEQSFDWEEYLKQYNTWFREALSKLDAWDSKNRELRDKIPMVQTEYGPQKDPKKDAALTQLMLTQKMQLHKELFEKQSAAWTKYFQKYAKQNLALQSLLEKISYGQNLPADEKRILLPAIADIQARGLEALERMLWQEISLVMHGEQWYNEKTVAEFYLQQQ